MRYHYALSMTLAIAGGTATASAAFTGFSAPLVGQNQSTGAQMYYLYAEFDQADDVLVSLNNFQLLQGSMSGISHVDNSGLQGGAAWDPRHTIGSQAGNDSFVTINGSIGSTSITVLNNFGTGSAIANGAGWSSSGPLTAVGAGFRVRIAQFVGQFGNGNGFLASLGVSYRDTMNNTSTMSGFGTFLIGSAVPGPGALAMLALAGFGRSRRR